MGAFFNFELIDEDRLSGWQSGLLWRDGARKGSYLVFRDTIAQVKAGEVDCSQVPGAGALPPSPGVKTPPGDAFRPRSTVMTALAA